MVARLGIEPRLRAYETRVLAVGRPCYKRALCVLTGMPRAPGLPFAILTLRKNLGRTTVRLLDSERATLGVSVVQTRTRKIQLRLGRSCSL